ncbi:MAG: virulence RhuM family protein, partial [Desulfocapsa sp.]|nr:virulence RhuM family protein [Desulfocapsa sp.]
MKQDNTSQIIIYQTEAGQTKIEVLLEQETVWLTQKQVADLFQTSKQNISHHVRAVLEEGELQLEGTVKQYLTVQQEGSRTVKRKLDYYNLDMIISVGYRVKSHVATKFRIWATRQLKEYIVKGFVLDDERLKNPDAPFDYFDEL